MTTPEDSLDFDSGAAPAPDAPPPVKKLPVWPVFLVYALTGVMIFIGWVVVVAYYIVRPLLVKHGGPPGQAAVIKAMRSAATSPTLTIASLVSNTCCARSRSGSPWAGPPRAAGASSPRWRPTGP